MDNAPLRLLLALNASGECDILSRFLQPFLPDLLLCVVTSEAAYARALADAPFDKVIISSALSWADIPTLAQTLKARWPASSVALLASSNGVLADGAANLDVMLEVGAAFEMQLAAWLGDTGHCTVTSAVITPAPETSYGDLLKYRALFEASTDAVFIETLEGKILECNSMACEMYGYDRESLLRCAVSDLVPAALLPQLPDLINELLTGSMFVRAWGLRKDGAVFPTEVTTRLIETLEGQRVVVYVRDVSVYHREKAKLELLYHLAQYLSGPLKRDEVVQRALVEICAGMGAQRAMLAFWLKDKSELVFAAAAGYEAEKLHQSSQEYRLRLGEGLAGWAVARREAVLCPDVTQDPRWKVFPGLDDWVRTAISAPLIHGEALVGVLNIYSERPHFFNEEHLRLAESAAATIAGAMTIAELFEQIQNLLVVEQQRRKLAEALQAAAAAVSSNLNPDEVLDHILEEVERVVCGETFNIMLIQGDEVLVARVRGYEKLNLPHAVAGYKAPLREYPALVQLLNTADPLVVNDAQAEAGWLPLSGREWRRAFVVTPIRAANRTIGFLNVHHSQPGTFTLEDASRLKTFADHAATAIENARLYQALREHAAALEARVAERTAELQTEYARLEAVLQSTADGIVVTDAQGKILR